MASNYRFHRQTFLNRVQNAFVKLLALIGLLFTLRTLYDGGSLFEMLKFYTFDFLFNIITTITRGT